MDLNLLWGLFGRAVGLIYLIAFASLFGQIVGLAGELGITPVREVLRRIRIDFPSFRRFFYFPTLLWFGASDRALKFVIAAGAAAAVLAIAGGSGSPIALLVCWLCYLSLDIALDLVTPWDSLLLEAGFLAVFLSPLRSLPSIAATAPPALWIAWAYRFLFFRVMFGFGKQKFIGSTWADRDYLRGFYINQPMPTSIGWYAARLPMWFHQLSLAFMFVIEIFLPFLAFFPGKASLITATATAALMITIQIVGSFGIFNVLTIALCLPLLEPRSLHIDLTQPLAAAAALIVSIGGLIYLPFNSWVSRTWIHWPAVAKVRAFGVRHVLAFYRALSPFRIVHAYGVFPPNSLPPARWVPIIEGTADRKVWKEYEFRFMTSLPASRPAFAGPYQPRMDYSMVYEAYGQNYSGFLSTLTGTGNPYRFSNFSAMERLIQRLLEGSLPVRRLFRNDPFADKPPVEIRAKLMLFVPAKEGTWWERRFAGPHLPPASLRPELWDQWVPQPELFHPDEIVWRKRSVPSETDSNIEPFWHDFIPFVQSFGPPDWETLPDRVREVRDRYDIPALLEFEKIFGRLSWELSEKSDETPALSHFRRLLVAWYVIAQGKDNFRKALETKSSIDEFSKTTAPEDGLFFMALFRYETLALQARKIRLLQKLTPEPTPAPPKGLPGFVELIPFLAGQLHISGEEHAPRFTRADGFQFRGICELESPSQIKERK